MKYIPHYRLELVRDSNQLQVRREFLNGPAAAARILRQIMQPERLPNERFCVLTVNTRNQPLGFHMISEGCLNATIVHPREIMTRCCLDNAAAWFACHNHPSGAAIPSGEDDALTRRLVNASNIMGINLLDHIILGIPDYYSYKESGRL